MNCLEFIYLHIIYVNKLKDKKRVFGSKFFNFICFNLLILLLIFGINK